MTAPSIGDSAASTWRKKPVEVEAIEFDGTWSCYLAIEDWAGRGTVRGSRGHPGRDECDELLIATLEGDMIARPGDFIIRGVQHEFYPCKPDIFRATYDLVVPDSPTPCTTADCVNPSSAWLILYDCDCAMGGADDPACWGHWYCAICTATLTEGGQPSAFYGHAPTTRDPNRGDS